MIPEFFVKGKDFDYSIDSIKGIDIPKDLKLEGMVEFIGGQVNRCLFATIRTFANRVFEKFDTAIALLSSEAIWVSDGSSQTLKDRLEKVSDDDLENYFLNLFSESIRKAYSLVDALSLKVNIKVYIRGRLIDLYRGGGNKTLILLILEDRRLLEDTIVRLRQDLNLVTSSVAGGTSFPAAAENLTKKITNNFTNKERRKLWSVALKVLKLPIQHLSKMGFWLKHVILVGLVNLHFVWKKMARLKEGIVKVIGVASAKILAKCFYRKFIHLLQNKTSSSAPNSLHSKKNLKEHNAYLDRVTLTFSMIIGTYICFRWATDFVSFFVNIITGFIPLFSVSILIHELTHFIFILYYHLVNKIEFRFIVNARGIYFKFYTDNPKIYRTAIFSAQIISALVALFVTIFSYNQTSLYFTLLSVINSIFALSLKDFQDANKHVSFYSAFDRVYRQMRQIQTDLFRKRKPLLILIGGPFASGKGEFAKYYVPHCKIWWVKNPFFIISGDNWLYTRRNNNNNNNITKDLYPYSRYEIARWQEMMERLKEGKSIFVPLYIPIFGRRLNIPKKWVSRLLKDSNTVEEAGYKLIPVFAFAFADKPLSAFLPPKFFKQLKDKVNLIWKGKPELKRICNFIYIWRNLPLKEILLKKDNPQIYIDIETGDLLERIEFTKKDIVICEFEQALTFPKVRDLADITVFIEASPSVRKNYFMQRRSWAKRYFDLTEEEAERKLEKLFKKEEADTAFWKGRQYADTIADNNEFIDRINRRGKKRDPDEIIYDREEVIDLKVSELYELRLNYTTKVLIAIGNFITFLVKILKYTGFIIIFIKNVSGYIKERIRDIISFYKYKFFSSKIRVGLFLFLANALFGAFFFNSLPFIIKFLIALISIIIHEYSHARLACYYGDNTAKKLGRLTLNPIKHIDPIGTIALPILVGFGWAKPLPINIRKLSDRQLFFVALAGPFSNLVIALFFTILYHILNLFFILNNKFITDTIFFAIFVNILFAFFNLLPIPPLDGSRIYYTFLKDKALKRRYRRSELKGIVALIMFILIGGGQVLGFLSLVIMNYILMLPIIALSIDDTNIFYDKESPKPLWIEELEKLLIDYVSKEDSWDNMQNLIDFAEKKGIESEKLQQYLKNLCDRLDSQETSEYQDGQVHIQLLFKLENLEKLLIFYDLLLLIDYNTMWRILAEWATFEFMDHRETRRFKDYISTILDKLVKEGKLSKNYKDFIVAQFLRLPRDNRRLFEYMLEKYLTVSKFQEVSSNEPNFLIERDKKILRLLFRRSLSEEKRILSDRRKVEEIVSKYLEGKIKLDEALQLFRETGIDRNELLHILQTLFYGKEIPQATNKLVTSVYSIIYEEAFKPTSLIKKVSGENTNETKSKGVSSSSINSDKNKNFSRKENKSKKQNKCHKNLLENKFSPISFALIVGGVLILATFFVGNIFVFEYKFLGNLIMATLYVMGATSILLYYSYWTKETREATKAVSYPKLNIRLNLKLTFFVKYLKVNIKKYAKRFLQIFYRWQKILESKREEKYIAKKYLLEALQRKKEQERLHSFYAMMSKIREDAVNIFDEVTLKTKVLEALNLLESHLKNRITVQQEIERTNILWQQIQTRRYRQKQLKENLLSQINSLNREVINFGIHNAFLSGMVRSLTLDIESFDTLDDTFQFKVASLNLFIKELKRKVKAEVLQAEKLFKVLQKIKEDAKKIDDLEIFEKLKSLFILLKRYQKEAKNLLDTVRQLNTKLQDLNREFLKRKRNQDLYLSYFYSCCANLEYLRDSILKVHRNVLSLASGLDRLASKPLSEKIYAFQKIREDIDVVKQRLDIITQKNNTIVRNIKKAIIFAERLEDKRKILLAELVIFDTQLIGLLGEFILEYINNLYTRFNKIQLETKEEINDIVKVLHKLKLLLDLISFIHQKIIQDYKVMINKQLTLIEIDRILLQNRQNLNLARVYRRRIIFKLERLLKSIGKIEEQIYGYSAIDSYKKVIGLADKMKEIRLQTDALLEEIDSVYQHLVAEKNHKVFLYITKLQELLDLVDRYLGNGIKKDLDEIIEYIKDNKFSLAKDKWLKLKETIDRLFFSYKYHTKQIQKEKDIATNLFSVMNDMIGFKEVSSSSIKREEFPSDRALARKIRVIAGYIMPGQEEKISISLQDLEKANLNYVAPLWKYILDFWKELEKYFKLETSMINPLELFNDPFILDYRVIKDNENIRIYFILYLQNKTFKLKILKFSKGEFLEYKSGNLYQVTHIYGRKSQEASKFLLSWIAKGKTLESIIKEFNNPNPNNSSKVSSSISMSLYFPIGKGIFDQDGRLIDEVNRKLINILEKANAENRIRDFSYLPQNLIELIKNYPDIMKFFEKKNFKFIIPESDIRLRAPPGYLWYSSYKKYIIAVTVGLSEEQIYLFYLPVSLISLLIKTNNIKILQYILQYNPFQYNEIGNKEITEALTENVSVILRKKFRIVLVDDHPQQRLNSLMRLWQAGFLEVIDFENPLSAFNFIKDSSTVNCVVTDFDMPDMDGPVLMRNLRKVGFSGPIIIKSVGWGWRFDDLGEKIWAYNKLADDWLKEVERHFISFSHTLFDMEGIMPKMEKIVLSSAPLRNSSTVFLHHKVSGENSCVSSSININLSDERAKMIRKELETLDDQECNSATLPYILSNERAESVLVELERLPKAKDNKLLTHLGFAGWINLDILAIRRIDFGIFVDINPYLIEVWKIVEEIIRHPAIKRREFVETFIQALNRRRLDLLGNDLTSITPNLTIYRIRSLLNRPESWLGSDEKFKYIQEMFMRDRIAYFRLNALDKKRIRLLANILRKYDLRLDTIYISNIFDFLRKTKKPEDLEEIQRKFAKNLSLLGDNRTLLLESKIKNDIPQPPQITLNFHPISSL
ncbi:MAG: response regulator, partial [Candidatus Omnitrophica bacterium]|nr:response regulator [Candidatus Omnitrophota bacterium]